MAKREVFQPSGLISERKMIDEDALGFFMDDDDNCSVFSQVETSNAHFQMKDTIFQSSIEKKGPNKLIE